MAQAVLLTLSGHPSEYRFPIDDKIREDGMHLLECLNSDSMDDAEAKDALHAFVFPFLTARVVTGEYSKWNEVLECYLAIAALMDDGNFLDAPQLTQTFAMFKYLCRGTMLYEAFLRASDFEDNIYK